jgi:F0F1-type ATP synthase assembly protein I
MQSKPNPFDSFAKWMWFFIIFALIISMCVGCSSSYHLNMAIKKDPSLSLTDTVTRYKVLDGVKSRVRLPLFMGSDLITLEGIKVAYKPSNTVDSIYVEIECPPDSIIYKEIPKLVPIAYTDKQFLQEAKFRLSDWQRMRLALDMIASVAVLGLILGFLLKLLL